MNRILRKTVTALLLMAALLAVTACRDMFHSKEDIDYIDLVLGKEHSGSVKKGHRDYYRFRVEKGTEYTIECSVINWSSVRNIKIAAFWYDTGGTLIGEKKSSYDITATFTAFCDGDVVIRVTSDYYDGLEYTVKCYVGSGE